MGEERYEQELWGLVLFGPLCTCRRKKVNIFRQLKRWMHGIKHGRKYKQAIDYIYDRQKMATSCGVLIVKHQLTEEKELQRRRNTQNLQPPVFYAITPIFGVRKLGGRKF